MAPFVFLWAWSIHTRGSGRWSNRFKSVVSKKVVRRILSRRGGRGMPPLLGKFLRTIVVRSLISNRVKSESSDSFYTVLRFEITDFTKGENNWKTIKQTKRAVILLTSSTIIDSPKMSLINSYTYLRTYVYYVYIANSSKLNCQFLNLEPRWQLKYAIIGNTPLYLDTAFRKMVAHDQLHANN